MNEKWNKEQDEGWRCRRAGVTQAIVDAIHEKWKISEIVRLKIEGAPALNMKRMHEILEALLNHVGALETIVDKLRSEIDQMNSVKDQGDKEFYDNLDSAYASEDEDTEDERDEAYLETYNGGYESEDESANSIPKIHLETSFPYDDQYHQESETEPLDFETEAEAYVEPNTNKTHIRTDDSENEDDSFY